MFSSIRNERLVRRSGKLRLPVPLKNYIFQRSHNKSILGQKMSEDADFPEVS